MFNPLKNIGPGTLVAAAFIGPGTVTVCSKAGDAYGFTLLWALALSIFATIVLQEMSARLGLVYGKGLAEAIKAQLQQKWIRWSAVGLIIAAIIVGNSAYQAGNISGGVLGLNTIFSNTTISIASLEINYVIWIIGGIAGFVLYIGNYKILERILVSLVLVMSLAFILTAALTAPDLGDLLKGIFIPKQPEGSILTVMALVGTTVVPYNLFLHAALVKEKWQGISDLKAARKDTIISIILGGFVSMAIVICAAAVQSGQITNGADLAKGLQPLFGEYAKYFLGIGLFAAGITSAITAPMAAAYVAKGCFSFEGGLKSKQFRLVWLFVLLFGVIISSLNYKAVEIINFAQIVNAILLPIIAIFLVWIVNQVVIMKQYKNSVLQNVIGIGIILFTIILTVKTFIKVFG